MIDSKSTIKRKLNKHVDDDVTGLGDHIVFLRDSVSNTQSGAFGGIIPPALSLKIPELIFAALYSVL